MKSEKCIEMIKKNFIIKDDFKKYKSSKILDDEKLIFMVEFDDKFLVVKRIGKCDFKKCKNACCKFCSAGYIKDYSIGFFDREDDFGNLILDRNCNNITKNGRCKLWKTKKFPNACRNFPIVGDSIYWNVADVCSFKYEILFTINRTTRSQTTMELIKCLREQYNGI